MSFTAGQGGPGTTAFPVSCGWSRFPSTLLSARQCVLRCRTVCPCPQTERFWVRPLVGALRGAFPVTQPAPWAVRAPGVAWPVRSRFLSPCAALRSAGHGARRGTTCLPSGPEPWSSVARASSFLEQRVCGGVQGRLLVMARAAGSCAEVADSRMHGVQRPLPSAPRACTCPSAPGPSSLPLRVWSVRTGPPCFPRLRPHATLSRSCATPNPQRFMLVASSVGTGEGAVGAASCVSPSLCPWRSGAHPVGGQAALCKLKPSKSISKGSLIRNGRTRICHFKGSSFPPHRWKALLF